MLHWKLPETVNKEIDSPTLKKAYSPDSLVSISKNKLFYYTKFSVTYGSNKKLVYCFISTAKPSGTREN